jgi:hypothetical protein
MKLSERMKHWPALTVHRVAEIEAALVSMEERLTALEPKNQTSIFAPAEEVKTAPFLPISSFPPVPAATAPIPEPSVLPGPEPKKNLLAPEYKAPAALGEAHPNPLDGTNLKS